MKREILFKAKRVDNGQWVEGDLINWHPKLNPRIVNGYVVIGNNQNEVDYNETNYEVHPDTVCQFTGLLDKNGNKIFEGDKINVSPLTKSGRIEIVRLLYVGGFLSIHPFQSDGFHWSSLESEITGNIHDETH